MLTGAVGVVSSGTAAASITGAEWSNHEALFLDSVSVITWKHCLQRSNNDIMADDQSSQSWSIDKDDYELNEVIGE